MTNETIKIKIVTPERLVFEDEVDQVTLPAQTGEVTILPNHISYIAMLKEGEVLTKKNGSQVWLFVSGGFVEFSNNELVILADAAERAEDIDLERAEEAKRRAEGIEKSEASENSIEMTQAITAIKRETVRIKVAKKHHTKHMIDVSK